MRGLVSLVGVGPGDPELLTLRGARVIAAADSVLYDALVHPHVLRHCREGAELLSVGKRGGEESTTQEEINHMLLMRARQGLKVVRLKGGDPWIFGRGAEEAEFLAAEGVAFEIIPGVTAALGATAYAGIPLTHRGLSSSVAFMTSTLHADHAIDSPARPHPASTVDTLVCYMAMHRLAEELSAIVAAGRDPTTPAAVIQWGTWPSQRVIVGTVGDLAERCASANIGSPALVVVGEVVRLRERLRWWDNRPLSGRRVLVTRAAEQGGILVEALLNRGADPVELPMIRFEPPTDPTLVDLAISRLAQGHYDLVAFTSRNAVDRFFPAMRNCNLDARALGSTKVVAIGPSTEAVLLDVGIIADATPRDSTGEGLAAAILELLGPKIASARILIPRAEVARDALPNALIAAGAVVDVVPVYRTFATVPANLDAVWAQFIHDGLDVVTFTSSSTVVELCSLLGTDASELLSHSLVASIGPETSKTIRSHGLTVGVEATVHTIDGLLDALEAHFTR